MSVRQIIYDGVGGLKLAQVRENEDGKLGASLKYDGSQYHLHIVKGRAYALTSKRESVKTNMYNDRIDNFPELRDVEFPFKKETIIVTEINADHLYGEFMDEKLLDKKGKPYRWSNRAAFVSSIMNANPETVEARYPKGNPLRLVSFSVLWYEGDDVRSRNYTYKYKLLKKYFRSAGKSGEKVSTKKGAPLVYRTALITIGEMRETDENMLNEGYIRNEEFVLEGFVVNDLLSNSAFKIKRLKEADVVVIGYDWNSTGKYKENGWIKSILVGCFTINNAKTKKKNSLTKTEVKNFVKDGSLKLVGKISGFPEADREEISSHPDKWLGEAVEAEFHEWTGKAMRHPRISEKGFRTDKLINRCTINQME